MVILLELLHGANLLHLAVGSRVAVLPSPHLKGNYLWIGQSWFDTRQCFEKNLRKLKMISYRYFSFCIRNPTYNYEITLFLKWSDPTCLFIFFPVCCLRRCLQIEGHQPLKKMMTEKKVLTHGI